MPYYISTAIKITVYDGHICFLDVDGTTHFMYSHKYNTNSAEDSSDMN